MATGACIIKDCGLPPVAVDPYAYVKHGGHHEIGSGIAYRCKGHMFNLLGNVPSNIYVIKCTDNGQWETANFFCRYWRSDLNAFCPPGYIYQNDTCYMAHAEPKTRDAAEEYCATQNGHLLSVFEPATTWGKFTFPGSVGQVLLDGRHYSGAWYNWAGQNLPYRALLDPAPQHGHDCVLLSVTDFSLEAVSCSQNFSFFCQFELCPTTAGYELSEEDVCFKVRSESKFHDIECMENVTVKAMKDFYRSAVMDYHYLNGTTWYQKRHDRQYLKSVSSYGKYAFYYENVTSNLIEAHFQTCFPKGLVVGSPGTEELKWRFRHILGNRASVVLVCMLLYQYTYLWAPQKESPPDPSLTLVKNSQRSTDTNKCVKFIAYRYESYLRTVNCEEKLMFVCAVVTGRNAHDLQLFTTKATYNEAQMKCESVGKTLVPFYTGVLENVLDFLEQENASLSERTPYYTGHYLVSRTYTYHCWYGSRLVKEQDMNFRSTYTNDTKDSHQQVIYYPDTDNYGLAKYKNEFFNFVCQSRYPAMWIRPGPDNNTAYVLVKHQYRKASLVSSENFLPYVCSIDTIDIIRSLILPRK